MDWVQAAANSISLSHATSSLRVLRIVHASDYQFRVSHLPMLDEVQHRALVSHLAEVPYLSIACLESQSPGIIAKICGGDAVAPVVGA
jgi:hypothetical protein